MNVRSVTLYCLARYYIYSSVIGFEIGSYTYWLFAKKDTTYCFGQLQYCTLQMKGPRDSNINVWFPFTYSQKWNCGAASLFLKQNYNILSPNSYAHIFRMSVYFAAAKYVDQSWEYINRSHIYESSNWDWGRAIPFPGLYGLSQKNLLTLLSL
jgi:hypothetical protein